MGFRFNPLTSQLDLVGGSSPLTTKGDLYTYSTADDRLPVGGDGTVLSSDSSQATGLKWISVGGTGTVTNVSVASANGVSGSVANPTTTPAITLALGAITPTTVNGVTVSGSGTPTLAVTGTTAVSGTNTGDQTITLTGDVTGSGTGSFATTVKSNLNLPGSPTTTTQSAGDNSTKISTTAFVTTAVSNAIAGVNPAVAVQAATNAVLPNSPTYNNGVAGVGATITAGVTNNTLVVDGYTPSLNDRILVKNESAGLGAAKNGVYTVTQLAALGLAWILTRALDYDTPSDMNNTGAIPVVNGTANTDTSWVQTSQVTTVGTDAVTFTQFSLNPTTIVVGPASSTSGDIPTFNNTTGTLLADSGKTLPTGAVVGTTDTQTISGKILSDAFLGNSFQSQSATAENLTLTASTDFVYNNVLEIGSTKTLEIPATSTLEVESYVDQPYINNTLGIAPDANNTFLSQSKLTQNVTLPPSTDFLVSNTLDISVSYTLEIPATSTLEITAFSSGDTLYNKTITSTTNTVGSNLLTNPYKFSVYRNAAQNTAGGSFTKINFDTKTFDTGTNFDVTTNFRFTAPVAGFYQFEARVSAGPSPGQFVCALYKNGSVYKRGTHVFDNSAHTVGSNVAGLIQAAASDFFEVFIFADNTVAMEVGSTVNTWFDGSLMSIT